jgi:hypothetical protein
MAEISATPGQLISAGAGTSFDVVPSVPVAKDTFNRRARIGRPSPADSGEATELTMLLDGVSVFASWWSAQTPTNSLKRAYLRARGRRSVAFWPYVQAAGGSWARVTSPGRSSSQAVRWWSSISVAGPVFTVSAELSYADLREARPSSGIALTDVSVVSLTPGVTTSVLSASGNTLRFTVVPGSYRSVLLHISAIEARGYDGFTEAELSGAPARLDQTVELILPS